MARVKRGTIAHVKHKKILKLAKGYRGRNSKVFRVAKEKVEKGLQYAYRDRRAKKTAWKIIQTVLCFFLIISGPLWLFPPIQRKSLAHLKRWQPMPFGPRKYRPWTSRP